VAWKPICNIPQKTDCAKIERSAYEYIFGGVLTEGDFLTFTTAYHSANIFGFVK
jgi:hypothetical protein